MSHLGNPPHFHVRKEPRHRTHHDNMNWYQENSTSKKEGATDSTAAMITTAYAPTKVQAEKEDDTDSTTTTTTTTATSMTGSEWDDYITEELTGTTAPHKKIHVFGKRRWMKPSRKWRKPDHQVSRGKEQSKLDITNKANAQTINGVFMFGGAARKVTETKISLPALKELPSVRLDRV